MLLPSETEYDKGIRAYLHPEKNDKYSLQFDDEPKCKMIEGTFFRRLDTDMNSGFFKTKGLPRNLTVKVVDNRVKEFKNVKMPKNLIS